MSTQQRRRMMMAQGVTYDGIPLMITNVGDENSIIALIPYGSFNARIYYKKDNDKFYKKWNYSAITLPPNSTLSLFGDSDGFSSSSSNYGNFSITGSSVKLSGRLASISHNNGKKYTYYKLFQNCTSVVEVSSDFLEGVNIPTSGYSGDSTLSYLFSNTGITQVPEGLFNFRKPVNSIYVCKSVYEYMFMDCKSLVSVPQNIFEKETFVCQLQYRGMFSGCSSLTQAPDLYATNAPYLCYGSMFVNCVSLENPPQILFNGYGGMQAFSGMFQGCTSLKQSPIMNDLIKDGEEWGQHRGMFFGCSSLNRVEVSFTQWKIHYQNNESIHTSEWLTNVSPTGTFICPKKLAEATDGYYDEEGNFVAGVGRGVNTVPKGWTIDFPVIDARDGDANSMALLTALVEHGLCPRGEYLMKSEADAIASIYSVFRNNKQITDFTSFQFFNGIKFLGGGNEATSPFAGSTLTRIILPDTLNEVNNYSFYNCSLLEYISIGKNTTLLSDRAFYLCNNLSRADYRGTLEDWLNMDTYYLGNPMSVGADLYINGELLAGDIVIPKSITKIKQRIFEGGKHITSITINHEITSIEGSAFAGCNSLTYIVLNSNTPPILKSLAIPTQTIIYVPDNSVDTYKTADVWSTLANRIKPLSELPQ